MEWLESTGGAALLSLVIAGVTSGLVVKLLQLGPDRRKIGADANLANANAAGVLTGEALAMVQEARAGQSDANRRAERAERTARRAWDRVGLLEQVMRAAGLPVPPYEDDEEGQDDEPQQ